jgi:hypothetical protein
MTGIHETIIEFVTTLEELNVQYALIGGLAVRAHSIPRPTWDLDLIAAIDQSLLPIVLAALARSGYDASPGTSMAAGMNWRSRR